MPTVQELILPPDVVANIPSIASAIRGSLFFATDEEKIYRAKNDLSSWEEALAGGAGGGAGLTVATLSLTNAQVLAMGNGGGTPITIVAAAGANMIIVPVGGAVYQNYTTGYSFGRSWVVQHNGSTNPLIRTTATCTDKTGVALWNITQERNTSQYSHTMANTALEVSLNATHSSGGNAANVTEVFVAYYVLDIS